MGILWRVGLLLGVVCCFQQIVDAKVLLNATTGGYTGLVVGIDKDTMNAVDRQTLIDNLKELLTNASKALHRATYGRLFFQQVTILLPVDDEDDMKNAFGSPIGAAESGELYSLADVRVSKAGSGDNDLLPRTFKRGDCGEPGDFIQLTHAYVMNTKNEAFVKHTGDPAKEFVRQWGMYRFGLFDENEPSRFYFHPERGDYESAYCANNVVNGSLRNSETGFSCDTADDQLLTFPPKDCRFVRDYADNNNNVTSSLLFNSRLPSIVEFCNETTHNRFAPTMQNLRCLGRSAWEIMRTHSDLMVEIEPVTRLDFSPPEFRLVSSNSNVSVVIMIDMSIFSRNMSVSDALITSLRKYLLFGAPDGTSLEISFVSATEHTFPLQMVIQNDTDRMVLIESIDYLLFNDTSTFVVHDDDPEDTDPDDPERYELPMWRNGVVMFIVASENLTMMSNWTTRLNGAHFAPIFINVAPDENLVRIADDTDGKVYAISGGRLQLEADMDAVLMEASDRFTDAHEFVQISNGVMKRTGDPSNLFLVDQPIVNDLKVVVSVMFVPNDFDDPSDSTRLFLAREAVVVVSPTNFYGDMSIELVAYSTSDVTRSLMTFTLADAHPGIWSLRRGPGYDPTNTIVVFQVFAVLPGSMFVRPMPALTTHPKLDRTIVERVDQLIVPRLTISMMHGGRMHTGGGLMANVSAKVYRPQGDTNGYRTVLKDDGKGADVVANDGIYSVFLTNVTDEGLYKVVPVVYGGGGLSCILQSRSDCFQRSSSPLYFEVKNVTINGSMQSTNDSIPPGTIKDLFLIDAKIYSNGTTLVALKWTAPGANYDHGTASGYDIRYFTDWSEARNFDFGMKVTPEMIVYGSMTPRAAGKVQMVVVKLQDQAHDEKNMFLSLRAFDAAGNVGNPSNVINVPSNTSKVKVPPTASEGSPTTTDVSPPATEPNNATQSNNETELNVTATVVVIIGTSETIHSTPAPSIKNAHSHDGVIASAVLLFAALAIMITVGIYMRYFSKKSKQNSFSYEEFQVGDRVASRIVH